MAVERLVKDGKVAVVVSLSSVGGGWSSDVSQSKREKALFDKVIAQAIVDGLASSSKGTLPAAARSTAAARLGVDVIKATDLMAFWLDQGTRFTIVSNDGAEMIAAYGPGDDVPEGAWTA